MNINLPHQVRLALYIITGVLSPVMVYLLATEVIGTLEMALWTAEVTFVSGLAAINVKE